MKCRLNAILTECDVCLSRMSHGNVVSVGCRFRGMLFLVGCRLCVVVCRFTGMSSQCSGMSSLCSGMSFHGDVVSVKWDVVTV